MTATRVYWSSRSRAIHTRSTCCRHIGEHPYSDLAVIALPKLRAKGLHVCVSCQKASP